MKQLLFPFLSCVMLSAASVLVSCGNFPGTAEVAVPGENEADHCDPPFVMGPCP